jgi:hypothetical protein
MNAKTVIQKMVALLSKEEVAFTYARLKDGTIVESPTFDVGEPLEIVSEDGTKSAAPDGEHELSLKDEEGNETLIKVFSEGGVITERENVELEEIEDAEMLPEEGSKEIPTEMEEQTYETAPGDIPQSGDGIPADVEQGEIVGVDEDIAKTIQDLSYRIEELEKQLKMKVDEEVVDKDADIEEEMAEIEIEVKEEDEDEDLPKLDGAPTDMVKKFSKAQTNDKSMSSRVSSQERFLMKMYNK